MKIRKIFMALFFMVIFASTRYAHADGLAVAAVDNKREIQGASVKQAVASGKQMDDLVELKESLNNLTQKLFDPANVLISYNAENYVSSIKYSDGSILSFAYEKTPDGKISAVLISINGSSSLRIVPGDDAAGKMSLASLPTLGAGVTNEQPPLYEGIDSDWTEYPASDDGSDPEHKSEKIFRFTKTLSPGSFEKWLWQFKKPTRLQKRDFPSHEPSSFETELSRIKEIFKDFEDAQKEALQVYLKTTDSENFQITHDLKTHLETAYGGIRDGLTGNGDPLNPSAAGAVLSPQSAPEIGPLPNPAEQGLIGVSENDLRAVETGTAQKILRTSLEKSLVKFNSKLEKLIPGQTIIKIQGNVTEIIIVLPETS